MNILFIGTNLGNSYLTYKALKKSYRNVDMININKSLISNSILSKIFIHLSPFIFEKYFFYFILNRIKKKI